MAAFHNKRVLLIDADPQCNSSLYVLPEQAFDLLYYDKKGFAIFGVLKSVERGEGYSKEFDFHNTPNFGISFLPGNPRLSLMEDLLSTDWIDAVSGNLRGI